MPVLFASLTGPLVNLATHAIRSLGLAGVLALCALTGVVSVPGTEPTMLFAGFNVYQHHLSLAGIIVFGVLGDMLGATIAYVIGFYATRELMEHGGKLHVSPRKIERAHAWFERRGDWVILVSRFIPFVRAGFPYAAGVARMPYARFAALATLGSIVWIAALGVLGRAVGQSWQTWRHHLEYADYAAVVILVAVIVYLVVRRRRRGATASEDGLTEARAGRPDAEPAASVDAMSR